MGVDDTANPGWAYYNFAADAAGVNTGTVGSPGDQSVKRIKPGETLLMFNNGNTNGSKGVARFRCPHHLDPGIQLFDFEDREGWILYDPLSDPYYKIYDDRPDVVNVEFRIYSVNKIIGWEVKYGHCNSDNANDMYTINKTYSSWGMEDGLYIDPAGTLAKSNAQQVVKIKKILEDLDFETADSEEARGLLHLKGKDNVNF